MTTFIIIFSLALIALFVMQAKGFKKINRLSFDNGELYKENTSLKHEVRGLRELVFELSAKLKRHEEQIQELHNMNRWYESRNMELLVKQQVSEEVLRQTNLSDVGGSMKGRYEGRSLKLVDKK